MRKRKKSYYRPYGGRRTSFLPKLIITLVVLAAVCFGILEGIVLSGARTQITGDPQVMVIFGCKVESWGPSMLLQDRLDTALDYLADHPDMTVVVTGGQGSDEPTTEAAAMRDYLAAHGVAEDQILLEDRSHNTWENIMYTLALLAERDYDATADVMLVSNGFHLSRIKMLWDRAAGGTYMISTLAAPSSHVPSRLKMYIREPLALVKSFLFDR